MPGQWWAAHELLPFSFQIGPRGGWSRGRLIFKLRTGRNPSEPHQRGTGISALTLGAWLAWAASAVQVYQAVIS